MKQFIVLILLAFLFGNANAQKKLILPVLGKINSDYWMVNFMDEDTTPVKIKDYQCGNYTYDGHEGTDFVIRSFAKMDSGVYVVAACDGVVFKVVDGLYDRNKISDKNKKLGNYIAIDHGDSLYAYYAHLRKFSAFVKSGDSVKKGQKIGLVGSSGNSSDPHLHFELYLGQKLVNPFVGNCNRTKAGFFEIQPNYDTMFRCIYQGLLNFEPTLDTIREEPKPKDIINYQDSFIGYWCQLISVKQGDSSTISWIDPNGYLWARYSYVHSTDLRFSYWWTFIQNPAYNQNAKSGAWRVEYAFNGVKIRELSFQLNAKQGVKRLEKYGVYMKSNTIVIPKHYAFNSINVFNISGILVKQIAIENNIYSYSLNMLHNGVYFLQMGAEGKFEYLKICIVNE